MKLTQLINVCHPTKVVGDTEIEITGIEIDSRLIKNGNIFVAMRGTQEDLIAFVSTLKGHKVMVKGNHDDIRDLRYKQLFDEICDYKEISDTLDGKNVKLVLCHYPILMWKDQHRGSILLYGHIHNSIEEYYFKKCLREMNNEDFFNRRAGEEVLRAYNVGCMMPYMDYEPKTLSEIVRGAEEYDFRSI